MHLFVDSNADTQRRALTKPRVRPVGPTAKPTDDCKLIGGADQRTASAPPAALWASASATTPPSQTPPDAAGHWRRGGELCF